MAEAAEVLGISKDAVRMRVRRGTLSYEKGEDGLVYVFLDPTADATGNATTNADRDAVPPGGPSRELVEEMRGRIEDLREQLAAEREAHREARRIIAGLVQRVPELEAHSGIPERPTETRARGSPLRADEGPEGAAPTQGPGGPEAGVGRPEGTASRGVPWWRRLLGG